MSALRATLSDGRLQPYLDLAEGDEHTALRLYEVNMRLSAAFYIPLQSVEIAVRNALDSQLCERFGPDWTDLSKIPLLHHQQDDVSRAITSAIDKRGDDYLHGDVVAELNFGFWVSILGPKNENDLWRKCFIHAFPHRPRGVERKKVQAALNSIRRLRNRIAHHCRIIHRDLTQNHDTILEVMGWVCPVARDWLEFHSTFDPSDIPASEALLPIEGLPAIDPAALAAPEPSRPTLGGRERLTIRR